MIVDYLKSWPLYILPQHLLSRIIFYLTRIRSPLVQPAIRIFSRYFKVDLAEAQHNDPTHYATFNAFFTRALKTEARPLATGKATLSSPADGAISQMGRIQEGRIFQAKGHDYSALELLGGLPERAEPFKNGSFMTIYLSPRDYHRVHMPLSGQLLEQVYVPGRLFSVAPHTTRTIPKLFARNERVIALFDTEFGQLAMVLVGAINVAAIETVWSGLVTPPPRKAVHQTRFAGINLQRGAEMGRFNMGSTVILLLEADIKWDSACKVASSVRMGEALGTLLSKKRD